MDTLDLKPRSNVELIDASFQFLRQNFALLFTTIAVTYAPIALVEFLSLSRASDVATSFTTIVVSWVFSAMAQAATIEIVATRYMGETITPADALRAVWRRLPTALGVTFSYGLVVGFMSFLFIIPGIYVATKYVAAMAAAMVEGLGTNAAMTRSGKLTDGSKRRVFNIFGLTILIYLVLNGVLTGIAAAFLPPQGAVLLARAAMAVTNPFLFILVTLVYFDLRIRREGLDLDLMMAPVPVGATSPVAG